MGCFLKETGIIRDFNAPVGCTVTVKINPNNAGADIVHIRYAGTELDKTPPFQFQVKTGTNMLVVLVEALQSGATLELAESCSGAAAQVIDEYHFDPLNPARGYTIKGIAR